MNFFKKLFDKNYKFNHLRHQALSRLTDDTYCYLFDEMMTDEWVCLDFELTGVNPKTDKILSVGAVKIIKDNDFFDAGYVIGTVYDLPSTHHADHRQYCHSWASSDGFGGWCGLSDDVAGVVAAGWQSSDCGILSTDG